MVAIARAFAESASIYCLDEPTTSLTEHEKHALFAVIRNLQAMGATVIYVSHDLDDVLELTDKVTVMRDGKVVGIYDTGAITKDRLISTMIGRDLTAAFPSKTANINDVVFAASGLRGERVHQVSFDLHAGEILGIAGLLGSGRTEILRMIYGVDPIHNGTLTLHGQEFRPTCPQDSIRRGIVLIPEERRSQGLLLDRSIYENISLVYLNEFVKGPFLKHDAEKKEAEHIGRAVRLKAADYRQHVKTISGGNQQKVVFAKYLLRQPVVLLLDEPTRGIDVGAKAEIYRLVRELSDLGKGVIFVSSDLEEVLMVSDMLLVLTNGRITYNGENKGISMEEVMRYATTAPSAGCAATN